MCPSSAPEPGLGCVRVVCPPSNTHRGQSDPAGPRLRASGRAEASNMSPRRCHSQGAWCCGPSLYSGFLAAGRLAHRLRLPASCPHPPLSPSPRGPPLQGAVGMGALMVETPQVIVLWGCPLGSSATLLAAAGPREPGSLFSPPFFIPPPAQASSHLRAHPSPALSPRVDGGPVLSQRCVALSFPQPQESESHAAGQRFSPKHPRRQMETCDPLSEWAEGPGGVISSDCYKKERRQGTDPAAELPSAGVWGREEGFLQFFRSLEGLGGPGRDGLLPRGPAPGGRKQLV